MTSNKLGTLTKEGILKGRTLGYLIRYYLESVPKVEVGKVDDLLLLNNTLTDRNCHSDKYSATDTHPVMAVANYLKGMEPRNNVLDSLGGSYQYKCLDSYSMV